MQNSNASLNTVNESNVTVDDNGRKKYILGGTFTEFDVKNRNERIYTADRFLPCLEELQSRMEQFGAIYGEFDHPDVFDTSLSNASHVIRDINYNQESNLVEGKIQLIDAGKGKDAIAFVEQGLPLFVSSRAAGVTESDGTVTLKKLFTYDMVADPGFASAKMGMLNESCGISENSNIKIYEMSDESKINDLFNMNKNDLVTKNQLSDYSKYLVKEITETKKMLNEQVKKGELTPKKMEELLAYYENLQEDNSKLVKYLDYLAEKIQYVVNENKSLKEGQTKIVNDNLKMNEKIEQSIKFSDYLAENLDNSIKYNEYIAENLDKAISFSDYLAENLEKSIDYSEYIAENLDKNIEYSEYIAEHVDNNISYSEYIAEHLEGNIAYTEYIAEHLDDNIAYSDYIAENLDKSISYSGLIAEKLNSNSKINENFDEEGEEMAFPTPEQGGFDMVEDEEETEEFVDTDTDETDVVAVDGEGEENETETEDNCSCEDDETSETDEESGVEVEVDVTVEDEDETDEDESEMNTDTEDSEREVEEDGMFKENKTSNLSTQIDNLISEAKKRKASETNEHHFLKFLNKAQVDSFYGLTKDDQETVVAHINEKGNYFTSGDVLKLMKESLSTKEESLEERVIRLMPDGIKPIWESLDEKSQRSVLSQAKLHPELNSEETIAHFWETRKMKTNESVTKTLVSKDSLIQEDTLSDDAINGIMERFKTL